MEKKYHRWLSIACIVTCLGIYPACIAAGMFWNIAWCFPFWYSVMYFAENYEGDFI